MRYRKAEPWLFLLPSLIVLLLVFGYPVLRLVTLSFQHRRNGLIVFAGFENFQQLFRDDTFLQGVKNNGILLFCVPIMVVVALVLAILLFEQVRGWTFYRSAFFLPYLLPITVVGLAFSYIFQLNGALNDFLKAIGLSGLALDWLGDMKLALPTIMFVIIWKEVGFGVILFLARLMSVEEDLFDAAKIDGANWWQLQWNITIPQLSSVIEFFTVVSVITMLSWVFGYVYVMTSGGPGKSTMVTELYIYYQGFRFNQMNLAATASLVLLLVTGVFIFLELRLRDQGDVEESLG